MMKEEVSGFFLDSEAWVSSASKKLNVAETSSAPGSSPVSTAATAVLNPMIMVVAISVNKCFHDLPLALVIYFSGLYS